MNIELPAYDFIESLRFAAHAAGKKDVRPYVNGVAFDRTGHSTLTLIGTDGHRLAHARLESPDDAGDVGLWAVRIDDVESLLRTLKATRAKPGRVRITADDEGVIVGDLSGAGAVYRLRLVEGKYPAWRRIAFPTLKPQPTESFGMNSHYLEQAGRACARVANSKYHGVRVDLRGADGLVTFTAGICDADFSHLAEAVVCVMPMRL